jgi:hypothetical protein
MGYRVLHRPVEPAGVLENWESELKPNSGNGDLSGLGPVILTDFF